MAMRTVTHSRPVRTPCPAVNAVSMPHHIQPRASAGHRDNEQVASHSRGSNGAQLSRRGMLTLGAVASVALPNWPAFAVQGLTAGRIPGLSSEADASGFFTYTRPEGKSGGHGVGWSEIPRYAFKVPSGWEEIPVSIADLGGTEIDLRYQSKDQGDVAVVVAPILRFKDVGFNAQVTVEDLGAPEKIIKGFAPELFGKPVDDEDILEVDTGKRGPLTYYNYYIKPYKLVSLTAYGNRVFILSVAASSRQWRKHEDTLRKIVRTFQVV